MEWLKKNKKIMLVGAIVFVLLLCIGLWGCSEKHKSKEQLVVTENSEKSKEKKEVKDKTDTKDAEVKDKEDKKEIAKSAEGSDKGTISNGSSMSGKNDNSSSNSEISNNRTSNEDKGTTDKNDNGSNSNDKGNDKDEDNEDKEEEEKHSHSWEPVYKEVDKGYWKQELVKEAGVEEVPTYTMVWVTRCNGCSIVLNDMAEAREHMKSQALLGNYACGGYTSKQEKQQNGTKLVEHPAEYKDIWVSDMVKEVDYYKCSCGVTK